MQPPARTENALGLGKGLGRFLLAALLLSFPQLVSASNYAILYYFMGWQLFTWVWPFLLPLFFLRRAESRLKLYLCLVLLPLGLRELTDLPMLIYYDLAAWEVGLEIVPMPGFYIFGRQLLALFLSLWLLPKLKRICLSS